MASASTDSPLTRRIIKSFLQFLATGTTTDFYLKKKNPKVEAISSPFWCKLDPCSALYSSIHLILAS
jgi:hypothetical protein